jgi:hypothetical protein
MPIFNRGEFPFPFFFEGVQEISTEFAVLLLAVPAIALMVPWPIAGAISGG